MVDNVLKITVFMSQMKQAGRTRDRTVKLVSLKDF